ncbi:hypothetical protein EGH25_10475 [Haladaptatus sp. F3-133]|uniref:Uncharacterized protein n=1 Tax=Halorutilus salinus TaxID=2487751 RepID=A0A9Q4GJC3_9EURY|nr:hypothetical protein [Halorutilus salinus]MCX2819773.1 hypothetical protein [Halorutilus salinus]
MTELNCGCGHTWNYTGSLTDHTTCPSCSRSVEIPSSHADDGFKTHDSDEEIQRLKARVSRLEDTVDRLVERVEDDPNDRRRRGFKTDTDEANDDEDGGNDENDGIYDPTKGF